MDEDDRGESPTLRAGHGHSPRYQLALSYAEPDRDFVARFAARLRELGIQFFDPGADVSLLGTYRPQEIERIYREDARHVILFISAAYASDLKVRSEQRAAVDRAINVDRFALPARFDDATIPGLSSNIGAVRLDIEGRVGETPERLAAIAAEWLALDGEVADTPLDSNLQAEFVPSMLNCVVVTSEAEDSAGSQKLYSAFGSILRGEEAEGVWGAVHQALHDSATHTGKRDLPDRYSPGAIRSIEVRVTEAFASGHALERSVKSIIEADLAIFDVTNFEPGVMLLLGVRAATRRGVTIASHGGGWIEGTPLDRPFNLADLSLASHTPRLRAGSADDPRVRRLSRRIQTGFRQLRLHPQYHDLPVYGALRNLGADPTAWAPISLSEEVLVLCSYAQAHYEIWTQLESQIGDALLQTAGRAAILRMLDFATPQVVSQALYERIRRCVGCVVDWTRGSPSTFFELGVRLVASPWGTVQVASRTWLDGAVSEAPSARSAGDRGSPIQLRNMKKIFEPITYGAPVGPQFGGAVVDLLVQISKSGGASGHQIRRVAAGALQQVEPRTPQVATALATAADELDNLERDRENLPQMLFFEAQSIKQDHEIAAQERRLAAWLYLEHRFHAGARAGDDPLLMQWRKLGQQVARSLMESDDDADIDMGLEIADRVEPR